MWPQSGTVLVSYVMNKLLARKIKTIDMVSSLKASMNNSFIRQLFIIFTLNKV